MTVMSLYIEYDIYIETCSEGLKFHKQEDKSTWTIS